MQEVKDDWRIYFCILFIAAIASSVFWTAYAINRYNTFVDGYYDIGILTYSFFYNLHYSGIASGLQFLVYANHIAPDQALFLPFFYLLQSPIMLFAIQAVILSMTSLLVFVIALDILKSKGFALMLGFIYLLNPGMMGLMVFDYHPEFLIIPLYLLSFYFFMKNRKWPFLLSLLFLLCTLDTVVFIAIALGVGLLYYSVTYARESEGRSEKIRMSVYAIALSALFLMLYIAGASILAQQYATGYQLLPPYLKAIPFDALSINGIFGNVLNAPVNETFINQSLSFINSTTPNLPYAFIGISVALLAFGIAIFADPILTLLLASPWLIQFLLLGKQVFGDVNNEYFSYVIGASIAAAILGIMIIRKKRGLFMLLNVKAVFTTKGANYMVMSAMIISVYVFAVGVDIIATNNNLAFWSAPNATVANCNSQLSSMIDLLPQNASVMVQDFVTPHVANRQYMETPGVPGVPTQGYFRPDYIIIDQSPLCFSEFNGPNAYYKFADVYITNYINANKYVLAAQNGTAQLYRSPT